MTPPIQPSCPLDRVAAASPQPSERVMEYLLAECERPGLKDGSRLPTIRDLSVQLNVSPPTVHAVLQRLVKQGIVRTIAGRGSFLVSPRQKSSDTLNIALSMPLPGGQAGHYWCHRIAAAIVMAACQSKQPINLVPLPQSVTSDAATVSKLIEARSKADGLLLLPEIDADEIRRAYESAGKPVVDINPPSETTTANFVSTDYHGASRRLARAWVATGRQRTVFLGSNPGVIVSEQLRFSGFVSGLGGDLGRKISFQILETRLSSEAAPIDAIRPLFDHRASAPDAIYCAGDHLALDVICACREAGLRIPEDVSVVGATGLDLSDSICPQLTRLQQPFDQIGKESVSLLGDRIKMKNISLPGRIIPTGFMGGGTTRPEENAILGVGPHS